MLWFLLIPIGLYIVNVLPEWRSIVFRLCENKKQYGIMNLIIGFILFLAASFGGSTVGLFYPAKWIVVDNSLPIIEAWTNSPTPYFTKCELDNVEYFCYYYKKSDGALDERIIKVWNPLTSDEFYEEDRKDFVVTTYRWGVTSSIARWIGFVDDSPEIRAWDVHVPNGTIKLIESKKE